MRRRGTIPRYPADSCATTHPVRGEGVWRLVNIPKMIGIKIYLLSKIQSTWVEKGKRSDAYPYHDTDNTYGWHVNDEQHLNTYHIVYKCMLVLWLHLPCYPTATLRHFNTNTIHMYAYVGDRNCVSMAYV